MSDHPLRANRPRRTWLVGIAVILAAVLLCITLFMLLRTIDGPSPRHRLGQWIGQLDGVQWLLTQLDLDSLSSEQVALQWMEDGAGLAAQGRYDEALGSFEQAIEMAPDELAPYLGQADVYESQGNYVMALAVLDRASEAIPDDPRVLTHLGRLQCLVQDYETCTRTLEQAVETLPEDQWAHLWLAGAYRQSTPPRLDEAIAEYQRALQLDPTLTGAYLGLGRSLVAQPGGAAEAAEALQAGIDASLAQGDDEMASALRAELGSLRYEQDDYDACVRQWLKVLEENPDDPVAHRRLGLCYTMRDEEGDMLEGVLALERALIRDFPLMDAYYYYLGTYHFREGEYARAVWAWQQFLRFSGDPELNAEVEKQIDEILSQYETP